MEKIGDIESGSIFQLTTVIHHRKAFIESFHLHNITVTAKLLYGPGRLKLTNDEVMIAYKFNLHLAN